MAAKYNIVFNLEKIEVGDLAVFVGMLIRCQKKGPPVISPDPKNMGRALETHEPYKPGSQPNLILAANFYFGSKFWLGQ